MAFLRLQFNESFAFCTKYSGVKNARSLNLKRTDLVFLDLFVRSFFCRVTCTTLWCQKSLSWYRVHNFHLLSFFKRLIRWPCYLCVCTRLYPKVFGLASWSENCEWYSSLPLGVSLVSAITLRVASQRVFIMVVFISLSSQSGNFWLHHRRHPY